MPAKYSELELSLWKAIDELMANSNLKPSEYSAPVLGLIFLLHSAPEVVRSLSTEKDIGAALDRAMQKVALKNELTLPTGYSRLGNEIVRNLLTIFCHIPTETITADAISEIYQYFLERFTRQERQQGGEFYTPASLARLIVEIIEPNQGKILDPACGSGVMFIQAIERLRVLRAEDGVISLYGQDKIEATVQVCQMNASIHRIARSNICHANSYYEDKHSSVKAFDFVLANPPFNINGVNTEKLQQDARYPFGTSLTNANYIWIQMFYSALNEGGRAGFIMPNAASDARLKDQEIRRRLIETGCVDAIIAISPDIFPVACNLWFLDKRKIGQERENMVLFIDARQIYYQASRSCQEFREEQIDFIAGIVQLYRGKQVFSSKELTEIFPAKTYQDVAGLCKVATRQDIEFHEWSLNPLRYVEVTTSQFTSDSDFIEKLGKLRNEFNALITQSHELENQILNKLTNLLGEPNV